MDAEYLVQMVNDIADFFYPAQEPAAAAAAVAAHVRRAWDPRMRKQVIEVWRRGEGAFSDVGRASIAILAADPPRTG
jgi:NADH-dependent formate dehydrogenase delta subunit FdsD